MLNSAGFHLPLQMGKIPHWHPLSGIQTEGTDPKQGKNCEPYLKESSAAFKVYFQMFVI